MFSRFTPPVKAAVAIVATKAGFFASNALVVRHQSQQQQQAQAAAERARLAAEQARAAAEHARLWGPDCGIPHYHPELDTFDAHTIVASSR